MATKSLTFTISNHKIVTAIYPAILLKFTTYQIGQFFEELYTIYCHYIWFVANI